MYLVLSLDSPVSRHFLIKFTERPWTRVLSGDRGVQWVEHRRQSWTQTLSLPPVMFVALATFFIKREKV